MKNNEIKDFIHYTKSNSVRLNINVKNFFNYLLLIPDNEWHLLDKESIHRYLFKNLPYDDLKIRHIMSLALNEIETFIVDMKIKNNNTLHSNLLIEYYSQSGLDQYALNEIETAKRELNAQQINNSEYYFQKYYLETTQYNISSHNIRSEEFDFQQNIETFTAYAFIEILKIACKSIAIKKITEKQFENPLLSEVLRILPDSKYLNIPMLKIYYLLFQILNDDSDEHLNEFLFNLKQHEIAFSKSDLFIIYKAIINFCVKRLNFNQAKFGKLTFELYQYAISNNILLEGGEINRFTFTNVITLGLKLRDFDQSILFLNNFSHLINEIYRQNTVQYNLAKIKFAQKEYNEALKILLTEKISDKIWNLNSRYLVLKILFEQNDFELFKSNLTAFKVYVQRVKNVGYHREYFLKIVESLTVLMKLQSNSLKIKSHRFSENVPDYEWFNLMSNNLNSN